MESCVQVCFFLFSPRGLFLDGSPENHAINRTSLEAHHVLRKCSSLIRKNVLNLSKIRNIGTSCDSPSVRPVVIHFNIHVHQIEEKEVAHFHRDIKTQGNKVAQ